MTVSYESVSEGDDILEVKRTPTHLRVLQFMGASWMWGKQFYDPATAEKMGLAGPIVPGPMKHAYLQQYLTRWLAGAGTIRRLQVSHRRPDLHDVEMTLGGTVTRKHEENGEKLLEVELYIDNPDGERSVRGSATIAFR
ncbi:MAG: hypothetical protein V3V06_00380 [Dehalococcoidia bacterium]